MDFNYQNLQSQENENALNRQHDRSENALNRIHDSSENALNRQHEATENDKQLEANIAFQAANTGNFGPLSKLLDIPEDVLKNNYRDIRWWEASFPEYAKSLYPNHSYMHYDTGGKEINFGDLV